MRHLKSFGELNESVGEKLNPEITDERRSMDFSEGIHVEVNALYGMAKSALESHGLKVKDASLNSGNKFDGYQIRINTDKDQMDQMVLNVSFGKVGLEDQRSGSIDIRYNLDKQVVGKRSKHFGDVSINVEEQKNEIMHTLNNIIK